MATPPSSPTSRVKPGRFAIRGAWGVEPGDLAENRRLAGWARRQGRAAGAAQSPEADHEVSCCLHDGGIRNVEMDGSDNCRRDGGGEPRLRSAAPKPEARDRGPDRQG